MQEYRRAKDGSLTPIKKTSRYVYAGLLAAWMAAVVVKAVVDPRSISERWAEESTNSNTASQPTGQTASKDSGVQTASGSDDWTLSNAGNSLDGAAYAASKSFQFPDQKSRIDVSLTCTLKTRDVKIKIESYNDTPENGANAGSALVTQMDSNFKARPVGRIKIGNAEPAPLSVYFSVDSHSNVVSWDVLGFARLDWEQRAVSGAAYEASVDKIGAGNYLSANLPLIIEIQNEGGTEQLTIQKNSNSVNNVIEKCSSKDSPAFNSAASAPEPATPAGSVQQTAPVPDADTQGGTPTEPPQPTSP